MSTLLCTKHFASQGAQGTKHTLSYQMPLRKGGSHYLHYCERTKLRKLGDHERTQIRTLAPKSKIFISSVNSH